MMARTAEPPDVNFLISHVRSRDWRVAAAATEYVGQLREEDKLTPEQADAAVEKLWKALAAGGHWWRFGWDTDEGDYDMDLKALHLGSWPVLAIVTCRGCKPPVAAGAGLSDRHSVR